MEGVIMPTMNCPICQAKLVSTKQGWLHSVTKKHPEASGKIISGFDVARWQTQAGQSVINSGTHAAHMTNKY